MRAWQRLSVLASIVGLGSVLVLATGQRPSFTPEQEARLQIREIAAGLYVIPGFDGGQTGGNVAVRVTGDGVIIVDNKFPYSFDFITEQIASVTDEPIKYVLNTHHHGDHAGSNADFMRNAEVIAHKNARANIVRNNQDGAPRVIFADETAVFLGDAEVHAYHFGRGHTDGDTFVVFRAAGAMHTGDMFARKGLPFIDAVNGNGSATDFGSTLQKAVAGIRNVDRVIPGHATAVHTWSDFVDSSGFYNDVVMQAQRAKAAGQSVEEFIRSYRLPSEYSDFEVEEGRLTSIAGYLFDGR